MLISHLLSASSPFLSGASTQGMVSGMPMDQGGGSKSRCTEQPRGRLPVGDQDVRIGFTSFDVFQSEPWLLFSHSCTPTPTPQPVTPLVILKRRLWVSQEASCIAGETFYHTSTLTLVGKIGLRCSLLGLGSPTLGKR